MLAPSAPSRAQPGPGVADGLCLARDYDAAHLAAHPRQRVASVLLWVARPDLGGARHEARIAMRFRSETGWRRAVTECRVQGAAGRQHCGVECDGGGFSLEAGARPEERRLRPDRHGLELRESCGDGGTEDAVRLDPEPDDRLFLLRVVPAETCRAVLFPAGR
jgi:hypothetical protein